MLSMAFFSFTSGDKLGKCWVIYLFIKRALASLGSQAQVKMWGKSSADEWKRNFRKVGVITFNNMKLNVTFKWWKIRRLLFSFFGISLFPLLLHLLFLLPRFFRHNFVRTANCKLRNKDHIQMETINLVKMKYFTLFNATLRESLFQSTLPGHSRPIGFFFGNMLFDDD